MSRTTRVALVLSAAALLALPMLAEAQQRQGRGQGRGQGGGMGGGPALLLTQKSVQEELKMTDEQTKKATEFVAKQREAGQGLRDLSQEERQAKIKEMVAASEKAIAEILKPEQSKRLTEISLQQRGIAAVLRDSKLAESLKITDDQKEKIGQTVREVFQGGGAGAGGNREEVRKTLQEKLAGMLTDEQKAKWKEMIGAPFKGKIEQPMGGRRRGAGA